MRYKLISEKTITINDKQIKQCVVRDEQEKRYLDVSCGVDDDPIAVIESIENEANNG